MTGPIGYIRCLYRLLAATGQFNGNLFKYVTGLCRYLYNLYFLKCLAGTNNVFKLSLKYLYPCLNDWTEHTPVEPTYFFQDTWAAGKIFNKRPPHHYDVGSSIMTIGIISQYVPTTMVDIRPIDVELENLYFQKGSILALPIADQSIDSLSSLCVVEHIGLGRYGDSIDSWGSERAATELKRILKAGGDLYFSVPVDEECRVYFNAHRAFTRDYVLELFRGLKLVEEKYIYGKVLFEEYEKARGFGTGLFHFRKGQS